MVAMSYQLVMMGILVSAGLCMTLLSVRIFILTGFLNKVIAIAAGILTGCMMRFYCVDVLDQPGSTFSTLVTILDLCLTGMLFATYTGNNWLLDARRYSSTD